MNRFERGVIALGLLTWLGIACGGGDVPTRQLADTEASIRAAKEVGAEDNPDAALQLKMARDGLARAENLNKAGEHDEAKTVLEQAELDAELAVLLARQEASEAKASQAKLRAESLGSAKQSAPVEQQPEQPSKALPPGPAPQHQH
jgi:hypothetical protein